MIHPKTTQQIPQSQLKQSLFDALLKDPKLRERDKALFEVLSKGEDVLKPGKDTCRMDDLRKRSYGDPDHDYHKGENARSRNHCQDVKYTLSIIKYHATPYDRPDMEEHYDTFIRRRVVEYNKDAQYGIHHWPEL
ncbi:hypothetical protein Tco_0778465 [Tanacetum coccineum]